eukprot:1159260-Pelagomonas_calceolata.AAC.2
MAGRMRSKVSYTMRLQRVRAGKAVKSACAFSTAVTSGIAAPGTPPKQAGEEAWVREQKGETRETMLEQSRSVNEDVKKKRQHLDLYGIYSSGSCDWLAAVVVADNNEDDAPLAFLAGMKDYVRLALPAGVTDATSLVDQVNQGESVEWVNMCIRKASL